MKKVVAILLCVVMMLVGTPVALAADDAVIKVSDVKVNPGDTVSVTISLENNPGITGARIFVDYNSDVLTLKNVENGNVFAGTAPVLSPSFDVVPYQLQWSIGVKDMTDDGVLATMIFDVNENAEDGKYDISLTYDQEDIFNTKFENVHFDVSNGTVEISSGPATIDDFTYEIKDGGIVITGYVGTSGSVKIGSEYEIEGTVYKVIGIAESAFEGNEIVRSVEIPETVQYVGDYAFYDCTSLVKVTVLGKNTVLGEKSLGYYMINRRLDGVTKGFTIYGYTGSTAEAYAGTEEEITFVALSEECSHNYIEKVVAPTCVTEGYTIYVCDLCGESYIDKYVDKLGHSFTNYVSDKNATCEKDGTKTAKCDRCDLTDTIIDEDSKLGHSFTNYVSDKNATCEEDGTKTAKCDRCDLTDTIADEDSKLGHSFTNYVSDKNATCEEDGTKTAKCDRCDATDTIIDEGSKLGHSFTNYVSDKNATCEEDGTKTAKCDRCDLTDTIADEDSKLGHSFTNYVSDKNATCEEDGTKTAKCDRCDATDTIIDEGSKLGHSFTNYVSDKNATCEEDGTKTAKCDRCDATDTIIDEGSKLGHSFTNYVSDKNATCEEDGTKTAKCDRCDLTDTIADEGSKLGHSFTNYVSDKNATCEEDGTKTAKCDRCDATDTITDEDSKLGHKYGEWKHDAGTKAHIRVCENDSTHIESEECTFNSEVTKEVGCIENGIRTFTCTVCGYSYDETIAAPGHKDNDGNGVCDVCGMNICKHEGADHIYAVKATCASTGNIEYYHCEKCGLYAKDESFKAVIEKSNIITAVDPENHSGKTEIRNAKAASCEADGFTGDTYCLACNAKIADGKKIDKLGHSFTNYVSDKNATCEEDGTKTAKCDRCDATDTITDEGTKLGHSFTNYVSDKNATCEEDGTKTAKCDRCDATDTITDEGTKLGHSFTNYVSDKNATCEKDGTKTAKCDRCDATDTVTDEGTKTGHTVVIDAAVAATCKSTGLTEGKHCSVCGAVIVPQKVTEKLSHNFVKIGEVEATCTKDGYTICECTECGEQEKTDIVKALGHTDADDDGTCDVCGAEVTGFKSVEEFMNWVTMMLILVFKFLSMIAAS